MSNDADPPSLQPDSVPSLSPAEHRRMHDPLSYRQARVHVSLARLRSHPAVNATGSHAAHVVADPGPLPPVILPHSASKPPGIIQALFEDLAQRELGDDATVASPAEQRLLVDRYLLRNRAVAPKPSLSDPHFIHALSTGHQPAHLSDKALLAVVTDTKPPTMHSQSTSDVHRLIQEARAEKQKIEKAAKKAKTNLDSDLRRSSRKRERQDAALENGTTVASDEGEKVDDPKEPAEVTALRPTAETMRKTRSASARKARRSTSNPTPSECCFCPDPGLFGGEELKSELIGPFVDRKGKAKLFVHFDCACWAPQVFADSQSGQLRRVYDEYCRGRQLKCSDCGGRGATIGCYVQRCKRVFHLRCLSRSRAFRVERFFVAFCENHAHLGEKRSYKILMEAATIADVAAAHRREDTTFGLDAPHSRYTQLRRRETEVIFSRKMGICSHAGAFEANKVVFSHKRRTVLKKSERLSLGDRTRSLLVSAFDIASGRLAYMSVAGKDKTIEAMTAVEARAALASREHTSLLLLRNLRKAPRWTRDRITVVKSTTNDGPDPAQSPSAKQCTHLQSIHSAETKHTPADSNNVEGAKTAETGPPYGAQQASRLPECQELSTSGHNPSKPSPVNTVSIAVDNDAEGNGQELQEIQISSTPLPSFKKNLRAVVKASEKGCDAQQEKPSVGQSPNYQGLPEANPSDQAVEKKSLKLATKKRRGALCISKDGNSEGGQVQNSRQGLAGKVKSAWETFLEEQLPKERLLRPDDPEADAMRNMARLWSLLSVEAREEYQERARRAGMSACEPEEVGDGTQLTAAGRSNEKMVPSAAHNARVTAKGKGSKSIHRSDMGLFAGTGRSMDGRVRKERGSGSGSRRQPSVSLPRRLRFEERTDTAPLYQELVAVDWDDLLPTTLGEELTSNHTCPSERVRQPPARGKQL